MFRSVTGLPKKLELKNLGKEPWIREKIIGILNKNPEMFTWKVIKFELDAKNLSYILLFFG